MNQILVTGKIYMTPELRRKKMMYKIKFFLSVFLVCVLFSMYIYAECDRNKNEEVSREILANLDLKSIEDNSDIIDDTTVKVENNVLVVMLDEAQSDRQEVDITKLAKDAENFINNIGNNDSQQAEQEVYTTESGSQYITDAIINIPSLDISYPVLKTEDNIDDVLKISLVKFWGGNPNEVGNYVIAGHNYKNKKMFGKLSEMNIGDRFDLTDLKGRKLNYEVYDKSVVSPDDTACTTQRTNGKKEITLITCKNYGTQRLVIKAREVKN